MPVSLWGLGHTKQQVVPVWGRKQQLVTPTWWKGGTNAEWDRAGCSEQATILPKAHISSKLSQHSSTISKIPKAKPWQEAAVLFPPLFPPWHVRMGKSIKVFHPPSLPVRDVWQNYFLFISVVLKISLSIFKKIPGQIQSQHLSKPLSPGYAGSNPCSLATS